MTVRGGLRSAADSRACSTWWTSSRSSAIAWGSWPPSTRTRSTGSASPSASPSSTPSSTATASTAARLVTIEFAFTPIDEPTELVVSVRDQGEGFEAEEVADPLAPENILKSSGRGIFFMRSFMDDVQLQRAPEGGMEVRMVKKLAASG